MRGEVKRRKLRPWSRGCLLGSAICGVVLVLYIVAVLRNDESESESSYFSLDKRSGNVEHQMLVPKQPEPEVNGTMLIILSYMRCGTTLVGKLFDIDESALYIYEPMWYLCILAVPEFKKLRYLDGSTRDSPPSCRPLALKETESYLTCQISSINKGSLTQVWMQVASKTNTFYRCGLSPNCVSNFTNECLSSKLRVVKVLHLSADAVIPLLEKHPNLKVIHLVRDPRGQIHSRIPMKEYYYYSPIITGANICGDMLRNIRAFRQVSSLFSKQLLEIRYEDFAAEPMRFTEKIYDFLKMPLPDEVKKWVRDNTHARADDGILGTMRANSGLTSYKWRSTISWEMTFEMDSHCSRVYRELGYLKARSLNMLRNMSIPLKRELPEML